jgi:hypothetical protein
LFITDDPGARPLRHSIAPLSYIAAGGFTTLLADNNTNAGADHLGFRLTAEVGRIALLDATPPLVGDFNDDGLVDTSDYVVWRNGRAQIVPGGSGADANEDGVIDQADHHLWRANFGRSSANSGVRTDAAVPYWNVPSVAVIDYVTYMRQTTDYSQGRYPNGGVPYRFFMIPTPGTANPTAGSAAADSFFAELGASAPRRVRPPSRPSIVSAMENNSLLTVTLKAEAGNSASSVGMATVSDVSDKIPVKPMDSVLAEYFPTIAPVDVW